MIQVACTVLPVITVVITVACVALSILSLVLYPINKEPLLFFCKVFKKNNLMLFVYTILFFPTTFYVISMVAAAILTPLSLILYPLNQKPYHFFSQILQIRVDNSAPILNEIYNKLLRNFFLAHFQIRSPVQELEPAVQLDVDKGAAFIREEILSGVNKETMDSFIENDAFQKSTRLYQQKQFMFILGGLEKKWTFLDFSNQRPTNKF